jgi:hypothetical protein
VNFLVEKYELVRIDSKGFRWQEQSPYLRAVDILRARQAMGLLRKKLYQYITVNIRNNALIHIAAFLTYLLFQKHHLPMLAGAFRHIWTKYHANRSCNFN